MSDVKELQKAFEAKLNAAQAEIVSLKARMFDAQDAFAAQRRELETVIIAIAQRVGAQGEDGHIAVDSIIQKLEEAGFKLPEAEAEVEAE